MSDANDTTPTVESTEPILGRVKWFNNRAGFGFVTVLSGDKKNEDVFVHHTSIVVLLSNISILFRESTYLLY